MGKNLPKSGVLSLSMLAIVSGLFSSCSSAPSYKTNQSRIVLSTEDIRHDMTAKVSEVIRVGGSPSAITPADYRKNYIDVESNRYRVTVKCYKESKGGIYPSGSTKGTFDLRPGERLQLEFMRDQALVTKQQCPLLFSTNR
ncbi:MAG: hypothetical protein JKY67_13725 [Pseudomonadales bacterium]|nr:hypothetical protein [Pseudomonadales bacterium]